MFGRNKKQSGGPPAPTPRDYQRAGMRAPGFGSGWTYRKSVHDAVHRTGEGGWNVPDTMRGSLFIPPATKTKKQKGGW